MTWKPHMTVAAIIEQSGRFLLVQEHVDGETVLNQPAGHLEDGESLLDAVVRETMEETAWAFVPESLLGIYQWRHPENDRTFMRVAFTGQGLGQDSARPLDPDIETTLWLTAGEIRQRRAQLRSPMVLQCIDDYLGGRRYPLELLTRLG